MGVFKRGLAGVALGAFLAAGIVAPAQADVPESDDAIIIAINEWTGQHISAHVVGNILSRMGYNVEYVTAAVLPMATAIADGDIHYGSELWDNNLGEYFPSLLADGSVADMGDVGIDGREGWVYPIHLEQDCPGNVYVYCVFLDTCLLCLFKLTAYFNNKPICCLSFVQCLFWDCPGNDIPLYIPGKD